MNNLDKQYTALLQDILDNGVTKSDRTSTGTLSVFGRQIRHKMSDGFPLLTTKKMPFKTIVTELLWFLRGDSDIRFLWENNCTIWDGDWYKKYKTTCSSPYTLEEIKQKVKDGNHSFHDSMFDMGPIYGKQWREWNTLKWETTNQIDPSHPDRPMLKWKLDGIDQIANLINDLKTNPDSRRLMVNAWNVGELDKMTLPPCHYGFQVYTRELTMKERFEAAGRKESGTKIPTRAISLMWNQRSVDTFLGLPFNIASYGLLLEIIAKSVNMVPDELIGNLGDVHLYSNHIEQAKEQIGREFSFDERLSLLKKLDLVKEKRFIKAKNETIYNLANYYNIPTRTREPYPLPSLKHLKTDDFYKSLSEDLSLLNHLENTDFVMENYQSHPTIKAPLSN
jgi:thymidylate synthase